MPSKALLAASSTYSSTTRVDTECSSKTSMNIYQTTRYHTKWVAVAVTS
jgi:hypothetical protein